MLRHSAVLTFALMGLAPFACPQRLDTRTFIVIGTGLTAGQADYGLSAPVQDASFPAQAARRMRAMFPQPLIQPPGIGNIPGFPERTARMPIYPQGTVRVFASQPDPKDDGPSLFVFNLSVPGHTLDDALRMRPQWPIVQEKNVKQTLTNLILGMPALLFTDDVPLWTQAEYARSMFPTVTLIALGHTEAVDAAVSGDPARLPDTAVFGRGLSEIVKGLRGQWSEVIVATVPDPTESAFFTPLPLAARMLFTTESVLRERYSLSGTDYVTRTGIVEMSNQFQAGKTAPLPAGSILNGATAAEITRRLGLLNAQIAQTARDNGAKLYDLAAYTRSIRLSGARIGATEVTADYLGGFYSLDGIHPGITGHALIANDFIGFLNRTYNTRYAAIDTPAALAADPLSLSRRADK